MKTWPLRALAARDGEHPWRLCIGIDGYLLSSILSMVKKIRRMNVANIYATLQDITSQMKIEYQVQEKVLHR